MKNQIQKLKRSELQLPTDVEGSYFHPGHGSLTIVSDGTGLTLNYFDLEAYVLLLVNEIYVMVYVCVCVSLFVRIFVRGSVCASGQVGRSLCVRVCARVSV